MTFGFETSGKRSGGGPDFRARCAFRSQRFTDHACCQLRRRAECWPGLTASTQMATSVLGYGADGKQPAAIDIAGVVLNDQGKPAGSFKTRLNVNPAKSEAGAERAGVIYSHKLPLKPGIYQVRVAARDDQSGRVGSAAQWIEIPELAGKKLTMSSLMVGGQFIGSGQKQAGSEQVQFSVDRRFARGAHLNFLTIIYNAVRSTGGSPELQAQIKISRNGQSIVTSPLRKVVVNPPQTPLVYLTEPTLHCKRYRPDVICCR